jgi:hypothetical protein
MNLRHVLAACLLGCVQVAGADPADSLHAVLVVTADIDSARVLIGGQQAGFTPLTVEGLAPGLCVVRVRSRNPESWFVAGVDDTLSLVPGDTARLHARLLVRSQILTDPPGMPLYAGDSLVGFTPVLLGRSGIPGAPLTLRPPGSPSIPLAPPGAEGTLLLRVPSDGLPDDLVFSTLKQDRGISLPLAISGGAAILSGAAAAAWKVRAERIEGTYRVGGDPAAQASVRRLDGSATAALAAMQISIAVFLYFLLSE